MAITTQLFIEGLDRGNSVQIEGLQPAEKDELCEELDRRGTTYTIDTGSSGRHYAISVGQWDPPEGYQRSANCIRWTVAAP